MAFLFNAWGERRVTGFNQRVRSVDGRAGAEVEMQLQTIALLLQCKADPSALDAANRTALHLAVEHSNPKCAPARWQTRVCGDQSFFKVECPHGGGRGAA